MKKAMREAYGEVLVEIGRENPAVVVFDADLTKATRTEIFAKEFPERFFNMGISEAHMVGTAGGFALEGLIPVVSTFAVFMPGRTFDQIRNTVCYSNLNVKLVATHAGVSVGPDGGSHEAVEDLALMQSLPNMEVYSPADTYQTKAVIRYIINKKGPAYVRLPRQETDTVYNKEITDYSPEVDLLKTGEDLTIVATGLMAPAALKAAEYLEESGVSCRVLNVHCLKPLDEERILDAARETRGLVTVEDHSIIGGLGSAVTDCVTSSFPCPVEKVGVLDAFGQSGTSEELMDHYGLDVDSIVNKTFALWKTVSREGRDLYAGR